MPRIAMAAIALLSGRQAALVAAMVIGLGLALPPESHAQQATTSLLLVARQQMRDALFAQSVVLVTRHGRSRPMGVILNKPTDIKFGLEEGPDKGVATTHTLYRGGPVSPHVTVYLYKDPTVERPSARRDLLDLGGGLFMGMGSAVPGALLRQPEIRLKAFQGFSSWAHGQLEAEISRGDWLVLPFDAELALRGDVSRLWEELIAKASQRRI